MSSPTQPSVLCLYDADCGICGWCVELGKRWDRQGRVEFVSNLHAERYPPGVSADLVLETIVVNVAGESGYRVRADAVAGVLSALPAGRLLAWALRLPGLRALADRAYRWVSAHRLEISRAFGLGVCKVPAPGAREARRSTGDRSGTEFERVSK